MRKSMAATSSVTWFVTVGGTSGCLLPYLLGYWHFQWPLPYWGIARAAGVLLIGAGLVPVVQSFIEFFRAGGTPVPVAAPPSTGSTGEPCPPGCPGCAPGRQSVRSVLPES